MLKCFLVMILLEHLFYEANNKTEESIDSHTLIDYLNSGIVSVNAVCSLKILSIKHEDVNETYSLTISNDQFVDDMFKQILLNYICYQILQTDNYRLSENDFYVEYRSLLTSFNVKFRDFVLDELKIPDDLIRVPRTNTNKTSLFKKSPLW